MVIIIVTIFGNLGYIVDIAGRNLVVCFFRVLYFKLRRSTFREATAAAADIKSVLVIYCDRLVVFMEKALEIHAVIY